ncbi:11861_t:CDS:2 [Entrophospora sp. SA101]|nr:11861_t:CDS:2 [Entrophospora sp. SA101]
MCASKARDDSSDCSSPNIKSPTESSPTDNKLVFTLSPTPLSPKDKGTKQPFSSFHSDSESSNIGDILNGSSSSSSETLSNKRTGYPHFQIGVSEDRNRRCRRTMEDSHSFFYDFAGVEGQGFYAIFDGHAGKSAAEWSNGDVGKKKKQKRVLYTANVGDARAVLSRNNTAIRLSYDHKGSDAQEAKRIVDAGGFVMNNRVNGVLAVTRSLGDSSMKEYVIGSPYTTETNITESDSFLILACDGLWDVCNDQDAVNLVKDILDPQVASAKLIEHALQNFSTDNLSVMISNNLINAARIYSQVNGPGCVANERPIVSQSKKSEIKSQELEAFFMDKDNVTMSSYKDKPSNSLFEG